MATDRPAPRGQHMDAAAQSRRRHLPRQRRHHHRCNPTRAGESTPTGNTKLMNIFSDSQLYRTPLPSPIEVWLSRANVGITCTVVLEDERTSNLDVNALSIRGAQREITG